MKMATPHNEQCDVFIIGGGISGAAIAAECALRGLAVQLCDQGDIGGASSSQSDQIMPGALHFLRHHNLPYFNKVSKEKSLLRQRAPHLYTERPFVVVPAEGSPQSPISRIWLWLFQHWLQGNRDYSLAKRSASSYQLAPLNPPTRTPWVMQECMIDDARLVIENLLLAQQFGTRILPHHRFINAKRQKGLWLITLQDQQGNSFQVQSRSLINAAGAQVEQVQQNLEGIESRCWIELKRKVMLLLPKFYHGDQAYLFEAERSPISVTPYHDHYCLVASVTGVVPEQQWQDVGEHEISTLLAKLNHYFNVSLQRDAILRSYAVQQPFYSDSCQSSADGVEDYALDFNCSDGRSALISVFGGSFATHRAMAQEAVQMLGQYLSLNDCDSTTRPLPGGDIEPAAFDQFILKVATHYPWLPSHLLHHYCRTYGARCLELLGESAEIAELGTELCPGLYQREVEFLAQNEWVNTAQDILWRRTRMGLHASQTDQDRLQNWLDSFLRSPSATHGYTIWISTTAPGSTH